MVTSRLSHLSKLPLRPRSRPKAPPQTATRAERDLVVPGGLSLATGLVGLVQLLPASAQAAPAPTLQPASLKKVDARLLQLAREQGVTFQLVEPGDDLLQLGIVRPQPHEMVSQELKAMQAFADDLASQLQLRYDQRLRDLEPHLKARPGAWSMGGDPVASEVSRLRQERDRFAIEKIVESGLPLKLFSLRVPQDADPFVAAALQQRSRQPASLEAMARQHGATTPEQIEEFAGWVRDINGARFQHAIGSNDWKTTPIDHQRFGLLVPDLWYQQFPGQTALLDGHDRASLDQWAGPDGRVRASSTGVRGQFFFPVKKVVLRAEAAGGATPVHEFGHVLEHLLQERNPQFYKDWSAQVERAWQDSRLNSQPVSSYSQTNPGEFVAEGFAFYTLEPERLMERDPALFKLIHQMVQQLTD